MKRALKRAAFFGIAFGRIALGYGSACEWEDPQVSGINKQPARSATFAEGFTLSLDGDWTYMWKASPDDRSLDFFRSDFDSSEWYTIDVPSCVEMRGYGVPLYVNVKYPHQNNPPCIGTEYNPVSQFLKTFLLPSSWKGRRTFVRFDGVYSGFYLWVNGTRVGYSEDSRLPAEFDITPYLKPGVNKLAVESYRWTDGSYVEDQDTWRLSGIYRDVTLYSVPCTELRDFSVKHKLADDFSSAVTTVEVKSRALDGIAGKSTVSAMIRDAEGQTVVAFPSKAVEVPADGSDVTTVLTAAFPAPKLWSAETPYLYTLVVTQENADGTVDVRSKQTGFCSGRCATCRLRVCLRSSSESLTESLVKPQRRYC